MLRITVKAETHEPIWWPNMPGRQCRIPKLMGRRDSPPNVGPFWTALACDDHLCRLSKNGSRHHPTGRPAWQYGATTSNPWLTDQHAPTVANVTARRVGRHHLTTRPNISGRRSLYGDATVVGVGVSKKKPESTRDIKRGPPHGRQTVVTQGREWTTVSKLAGPHPSFSLFFRGHKSGPRRIFWKFVQEFAKCRCKACTLMQLWHLNFKIFGNVWQFWSHLRPGYSCVCRPLCRV